MDIDAVEGDGGAIDRAERGRVSGVDWNGVAELMIGRCVDHMRVSNQEEYNHKAV